MVSEGDAVHSRTLREVKANGDAVKSKEENTLYYFINRATNASAESLNSKLKSFRAKTGYFNPERPPVFCLRAKTGPFSPARFKFQTLGP